jgi:hypothetical protein
MTKDEILKMVAGKKMRELLATRVMGWELYEPEPFDDRPKKYWRDPFSKAAVGVDNWYPDEDLSDAWQLEKFFYSITVSKIMEDSSPIYESYVTASKNSKNIDGRAFAETAPLAICRAVLLAVLT